MGTPQTKTGSLEIWQKLCFLKRGAKLGERMEAGDFEEIMEMTKKIVLPFVKQLDKPIFLHAIDKEDVPKNYQEKRGILMFKSEVMNIWLQRTGKWFIRYQKEGTLNFVYHELSSSDISENIFYTSNRFLSNFVERARNCLEILPFLEQVFLYYILPLNFVTQSLETIKKAVDERRKQLSEIEDVFGFMSDFTQSLDPLTCRRKKLSLTEHSIFGETSRGESRDTAGYFVSGALDPFWEVARKRDNPKKHSQKNFRRQFDSLDHLIRHLMYVCSEIKETPSTNNSAKALFGRSSGRLPLSVTEIAVIKKLVESI